MRDTIWVFRNFGYAAGIRFVFDSLKRPFKHKSLDDMYAELNRASEQQEKESDPKLN